jgi:phage terminase large subunit
MWNARQETGRSVADIFAEHGIYLVKTSNDRVDGWMATREWLKVVPGPDGAPAARLRIFRGCCNLIRTLPQLTRRTRSADSASTGRSTRNDL